MLPKGSPTTSIEVLRSLPTLGAADVVLGGCLSDMAGHFCFSGLPCLTYQQSKKEHQNDDSVLLLVDSLEP